MLPDLDLINQQIKDLQRMLQLDLAPALRENYYDTLTFLLDTRALLLLKGSNEQSEEEKN